MTPTTTPTAAADAGPREMPWTPGPWHVGSVRYAGRYQLVEADAQGRGFVAEVPTPLTNGMQDERRREANARLIAAAPDLHAALQGMVALWEDAQGETEDSAVKAIAAACAALARATEQESDDGAR